MKKKKIHDFKVGDKVTLTADFLKGPIKGNNSTYRKGDTFEIGSFCWTDMRDIIGTWVYPKNESNGVSVFLLKHAKKKSRLKSTFRFIFALSCMLLLQLIFFVGASMIMKELGDSIILRLIFVIATVSALFFLIHYLTGLILGVCIKN